MTISTGKLTMKVKWHRKWWVAPAVFVCSFYLAMTGNNPDKHRSIAKWISANGNKFEVVLDD